MTDETPTGTPRERVEQLLLPMLEEMGLELYELDVFPSSGRIAIALDRKGARGPGTGVTLEETAKVTRQLRYLLETTAALPFDWSLEVGSPGIERDLKTLAHFVRSVGEQVRLVMDVEVAGSKLLEGRLVSADETMLVVEKATGEKLECKPNDVRRGRTVFDFSVYDSTPKRTARPPRARETRSADSDTAPTSTAGKKR
jgi:ribosome maturation factor RimP